MRYAHWEVTAPLRKSSSGRVQVLIYYSDFSIDCAPLEADMAAWSPQHPVQCLAPARHFINAIKWTP